MRELQFTNNTFSIPLFPAHEHFCHLAVMMVEEKALASVKCPNASHVAGSQLKVENIKVLRHAFLMS